MSEEGVCIYGILGVHNNFPSFSAYLANGVMMWQILSDLASNLLLKN